MSLQKRHLWQSMEDYQGLVHQCNGIDNTLSELFQQGRGVRQGSILSPTLFLTVIDEMLKEMCANGAGVSIAGLYLGSAAHADDIRSLSQTISATESQAASLINFTNNNGLKINASKTEVVALSRANQIPNLFSVAGYQVGTKQEAKCLGYWWKSKLGADKSVEANIEKGRKAFFAAGAIGAYQGNLNSV